MKQVYITPLFKKPDRADGGMRRVIEAQVKHLPTYGWEVTEDPYKADLINCHAGTYTDLNVDRPWIASCHGLYWTAEMNFGDWANPANAHVLINLHRADVITAPSEWVAGSLQRALCCDPVVIGHGIEPEEWPEEAAESQGYVLWNKARADVVCDPAEMNRLAAMAPNIKFVSTFGEQKANVEIVGRVPYDEMRGLVQRAGVYLCLARETFGINTLEAMVCGVPILGWAHGGQAEFVKHEEYGWLAKPGDYADLAKGLHWCLAHRAEIGAAARAYVLDRFTWEPQIARYAELYDSLLETWGEAKRGPKVSVVVTCYNLAQFLPECLDSILGQDATFTDWEAVVVDDCSPDQTAEIAKAYAARDRRIRYVKTPQNMYLAGARNYGIGASAGQYVLPLDADDLLAPRALATLSAALDGDRTLDIAYGHMEAWYQGRVNGPERERGGWPFGFRFERQMAHQNQLPYASMYRRRVWERIGGYRRHIRTAEDADFWCRATSYGFRPAKVTEAIYLVKRERQDSMGRVEPVSRTWTDWFPWARKPAITPAGAVVPSDRKPDLFAWPVRAHADPEVSVIIPVGPGHAEAVVKALDSVVAQTEANWEVVVANDTGAPLSLSGFPFARVVDTAGSQGAGAARNAGATAARADLLVFLDADDWLHPQFLEKALSVYRQGQREARADGPTIREYVYTDAQLVRGAAVELFQPPDITGTETLFESQHAVTTLLPKAAWAEVGGFDESMPGWEDWDFYIAVCAAGWCPVHLPEVLLAYDIYGGRRRDQALTEHYETVKAQILAKWGAYHRGEKRMACGGCGKRNRQPVAAAPTTDSVTASASVGAGGNGAALAGAVNEMVLVEYASPNRGAHSVRGPATGIQYGRRSGGDHFYVHPRDVAAMPNLFRQV